MAAVIGWRNGLSSPTVPVIVTVPGPTGIFTVSRAPTVPSALAYQALRCAGAY